MRDGPRDSHVDQLEKMVSENPGKVDRAIWHGIKEGDKDENADKTKPYGPPWKADSSNLRKFLKVF